MLHKVLIPALVPFTLLFSLTSVDAYSPLQELNLSHPDNKIRLSNKYSPNFMRFLEIGFGADGMISQGGYESVDRIFESIDLNGKKLLDLGSGLGGVDLYLAKKHAVDISGVDIDPFLIEQSEKLVKQESEKLKGSVSFYLARCAEELAQFPEDTFDIVFCKEVIYNISSDQKQRYLNELYRVLKPGGKLIVSDWFHRSADYSELFKKLWNDPGFCSYRSPEEFHFMLEIANFSEISFRDAREEHIDYTKKDLERLQAASGQIQEELGINVFDAHIKNWYLWLELQESGELFSGVFTATK